MITIESAQAIYTLVKAHGFTNRMARFFTCQAAHETGGFDSKLFKQNNNAFGMKYAGQYSAKGEKNGYAYYDSVTDSVQDVIIWWNYHKALTFWPLLITNLNGFVRVLKDNGYFEADYNEYLKGCQYWDKILFGNEEN